MAKFYRIGFWVSTALFCLMMAFSAYAYFTSEQVQAAFPHLGFPSYFRIELAIAKILGVIVLILPSPRRLKEWAYAGFAITLVSAVIAHISVGDGPSVFMMPVFAGVIWGASYFFFRKSSIRGLDRGEATSRPVPVRHAKGSTRPIPRQT